MTDVDFTGTKFTRKYDFETSPIIPGKGFTHTSIAMPTRDLEAMLSRLLIATKVRGYAK